MIADFMLNDRRGDLVCLFGSWTLERGLSVEVRTVFTSFIYRIALCDSEKGNKLY